MRSYLARALVWTGVGAVTGSILGLAVGLAAGWGSWLAFLGAFAGGLAAGVSSVLGELAFRASTAWDPRRRGPIAALASATGAAGVMFLVVGAFHVVAPWALVAPIAVAFAVGAGEYMSRRPRIRGARAS